MSNEQFFWAVGIGLAVILAIFLLRLFKVIPWPKDPGGGQ